MDMLVHQVIHQKLVGKIISMAALEITPGKFVVVDITGSSVEMYPCDHVYHGSLNNS